MSAFFIAIAKCRNCFRPRRSSRTLALGEVARHPSAAFETHLWTVFGPNSRSSRSLAPPGSTAVGFAQLLAISQGCFRRVMQTNHVRLLRLRLQIVGIECGRYLWRLRSSQGRSVATPAHCHRAGHHRPSAQRRWRADDQYRSTGLFTANPFCLRTCV